LRAGPLSNPKVIAILNAYFVCAYTSNDNIPGDAETAKKERAEWLRIRGDFLKAQLGVGDVSPYLLTPDGKPHSRLSIGPATQKDNLLELLEKCVADLKPAKGDPVVKAVPQSRPPEAPAGALVLSVVARKLTPKHSWNEFPSEDWIVLGRDQWRKLLPADDAKPGTTYEIDREVAASVLTHFFPQTEVCTASEATLFAPDGKYKHRLEKHGLTATVLTQQDGTVRVRLDGHLKLYHKFYPGRDDDNAVTGTVVGYIDVDTAKRKIAALRLVTEQATYAKMPIGVAVKN
jgi:hypothetical protein